MVQSKHRKSKPKKFTVKKHGKQVDMGQFRSQLDVLGLKIVQVTADGNCFFRALADQLEGNEEEYKKYRRMAVQYILKHREDFEPFIEDDVPFDEYCINMEKDGTWAGHMELQAASLVMRRNICIHQAMSPRWYIRNFNDHAASMIHLSYHDNEHYNSVRLKEDSCEGPARPIIIKVDADISATNGSKASSSDTDVESVKLVMAGTGCNSIDKIKQVLEDVSGDVDAAIEYLIAEQDMCTDEVNSIGTNNRDDNFGECAESEATREEASCDPIRLSNDSQPAESLECHDADKKMTRECSCGSNRKHNTCSGSTIEKSSKVPVISSKGHNTRKNKKETKRSKKKYTTEVPKQHTPVPDVGALCI